MLLTFTIASYFYFSLLRFEQCKLWPQIGPFYSPRTHRVAINRSESVYQLRFGLLRAAKRSEIRYAQYCYAREVRHVSAVNYASLCGFADQCTQGWYTEALVSCFRLASRYFCRLIVSVAYFCYGNVAQRSKSNTPLEQDIKNEFHDAISDFSVLADAANRSASYLLLGKNFHADYSAFFSRVAIFAKANCNSDENRLFNGIMLMRPSLFERANRQFSLCAERRDLRFDKR